MDKVDPMILFAAGSIAVGLAAAAICLRSSSTTVEKESTTVKLVQQPAVVKPKKKQTRSAKKSNPAPPAEVVVVSEASEIAAIMADLGPIEVQKKSVKKTKEAPKISASEIAAAAAARKAADIAEAKAILEEEAEAEREALAEKLLAEEEEKKSKKPKESPEQRAARSERQRLAKVKKVEEEELSKTAAIQLAASESLLMAPMLDSNGGAGVTHADGWAVVEDKRKVKAKALPPVVAAPVETEEAVSNEPVAPADFVKTEIPVDGRKIGIIIGPKGVTLHGIQDATGVEINTPKGDRDNTVPVIITVSGTADGVAVAIHAINELCTKGYSKLLGGEDFKEGSIDVHPIYLSEIIGKGGANIRAIQDFTGVKLSIPQVGREHVLPVRVSVAGNKDKVQEAKDIITELMLYYHTSVTHPGLIHAVMNVPSVLYNHIIGARGAEIKHIQANFKVAVHIPNVDSLTKSVVIVGDPVGVKGAEKYIQKIIDVAIADREAAEKMADSWVDGEAEEVGHEAWLDQVTHPSSRHPTDGVPTPMSGIKGFNSGAASAAIAAASASAWGAGILASADGW